MMLLMWLFWGCFIFNWALAILRNMEISLFFNNERNGQCVTVL